jgi:hypothetical protein
MDELLKNLNMHGEELHDVVLGKEEIQQWPDVQWLAAVKVLTNRKFNMQTLKNMMLEAWNPARDISFTAVRDNLFVLQAFCLGDLKKMMEEGPWLFRNCALMLEVIDGATVEPVTAPSRVQAWIQIHKIPLLYRNKKVLDQLASRVGEVVLSDLTPAHT